MIVADEYAPLSGWDELPIHQTLAPIRFVDTTDPRAFERYWFTAHALDGSFFLVTGVGVYPNLGTADAYAIFVHDGRQVNVRAHRRVSADRANLTVGPIRAELIAPFSQWRLSLGDNDQGLHFDLRWRDTKRARFRKMIVPTRSREINGRLLHDWCGYETFGTVEGQIEWRGKLLKFGSAEARGSRDHHWGIRNGVGGPRFSLDEPRSSHCGQWVEFGDWSIWGNQMLRNIGSFEHSASTIEPVDRKLRFDAVTKHLQGGIITNRLSNGDLREIRYEQVGNQTAFLRCAMYTGPDGRGTPEGDHHHGMDLGDLVDGESYDISDPLVRERIGGFEDHLCRATCNGETVIGILECRNPVLFEMCSDRASGYSILVD